MPAVRRISVPAAAEMGVAIEGSTKWWPDAAEAALLPELDPHIKSTCTIELFNRGQAPFGYSIKPGKKWLQVSAPRGTVREQKRIQLSVNWRKVPAGRHHIPLTITASDGRRISVTLPIHQPAASTSAPAIGCSE